MSNSADSDQVPQSAASDQDHHCLKIMQPLFKITQSDTPKLQMDLTNI